MKLNKIITSFLGVGIIGGMSVLAFIFSSSSYRALFQGNAECAVIFGAGVNKDGHPSDALYDRVMSGVRLYQDRRVDCLILSGGQSPFNVHEVDVMKTISLQNNIPKQVLRFDYKGINTLQTLKNLPKEVQSFVFVSNDYHLARIRMLAWKLDIENTSLHASNYLNGRYRKESYFIFREILGIGYYFLFLS